MQARPRCDTNRLNVEEDGEWITGEIAVTVHSTRANIQDQVKLLGSAADDIAKPFNTDELVTGVPCSWDFLRSRR